MASASTIEKPAETIESQIVSPMKLAHVVFRTSRFHEMLAWYRTVLHARTVFESEAIAFLAYDEEHHRIAMINMAGLGEQDTKHAGIHHVAFAFNSLTELMGNFKNLRELGIEPAWSVNHGPTTSFYYRDPDGNHLEFQVDNYDTVEEATEFFFTDDFATNPIGVDFDPDTLMERMAAGDPETELKRRPKSPPRTTAAY